MPTVIEIPYRTSWMVLSVDIGTHAKYQPGPLPVQLVVRSCAAGGSLPPTIIEPNDWALDASKLS